MQVERISSIGVASGAILPIIHRCDAALGPSPRSRCSPALVALFVTLAGCFPGNDAQYVAKQAERRHAEATRVRRLATAQTVRGAPVAGEALLGLVSERTWISEYETFPDGGKGTYRTYDYFRRDGHLVWVDNWIHREPRSDPADRWRVDGPRLCFVNGRFSREEKCFTVALDAQEAIQLYIDAPGTSNHELLTRVIRQTAAGAPRVTPSPAGP